MKCSASRPNPGHLALAEMERMINGRNGTFTLVTQNIDGLHGIAGSRNVIELHGSIRRWRCLRCGKAREEHAVAFEQYPPVCECGGFRRPDVVWFGEFLPEDAMSRAMAASISCDLFISVGTSGVVFPAADLLHIAMEGGARTIEVNTEPTPASSLVDWMLTGQAGDVLPELMREMEGMT